jgi:hypothetical protein
MVHKAFSVKTYPVLAQVSPNCVQKNIKYAASTQRRVLANLYKMKNEGTNNIS